MEFRTVIDIPKPAFQIEPREEMLFVGSCFADAIGQRFADNQFRATVNPFGTMYNPASVLHTVDKLTPLHTSPRGGLSSPSGDKREVASLSSCPRIVFITLGTNHVYRLKKTGEIVDNCQKRPASLFQEEALSVDQCADYLCRTVEMLRSRRPDVHIVFTVSPIRYRKYGYHESQLSKATLLLAVDKVISSLNPLHTSPRGGLSSPSGDKRGVASIIYFPAYEILMDELRDYRFYADDMLHPSSKAVDYIWQLLVEHYLSPAARQFLQEWAPLKAALGHRPFNPDSDDYRQFMADTQAKIDALLSRFP